MNKSELTRQVRNKALELGFISCGFSKSGFLESEAKHLETWLKKGHHGQMQYMENHFDKRLNPNLLVDGAKSVISVLVNYYPAEEVVWNNGLKISKYAYGNDYHHVIKNRLQTLLDFINDSVGEVSARCFTDSAPVLDKAWAERAGLGWIGKNGNLLSTKVGSFFFIGEIIIDIEFDYDQPVTDHCGTCTACIDACPTEAIVGPQEIDGSKCISYLTIELKDQVIPDQFKDQMDNWVFGCDVCQDVCPWNRFSKPHSYPEFEMSEEMKSLDLLSMTKDTFKTVFKSSAISRTKYEGLVRNVDFVAQKNPDRSQG